MRSGTAVSWLEPALNGEVLRVVHTCTTSDVQIIDRTDGSRVECVTLAAGRFVPVSQLIAGHEVKPPKKHAAPAGVKAKQNEQSESKTAAAVAATLVPGVNHGNGSRSSGNVQPRSHGERTRQAGGVPAELAPDSRQAGERVEVLAIDYLNVLCRAYHAGTKTETHAVRSMFQTVAEAVRQLRPAAVVFALDGGHDHRSALLPEYKAHRPEPEPGLQRQKLLGEQAIAAAGFQSIRLERFEADDVLASIGRSLAGVVIVSSDKDLLALSGRCRIYHPWSGGKFVTAEERLELPAGQVTDYLALCGDTSDGIPGVKGIGPKTAAELLKEFDSLDAILAAATLGTIPGAVGKKLKEQRDHALKCRQVVELRDALKLPELVGWRPRFDWRSQLQALGLASVEAIISSIEPHLKHTTTQERSPSLSAEREQSEQSGRDELQPDQLDVSPAQPSRSIPPELATPAETVVPGEPASRPADEAAAAGGSSQRIFRPITEQIRGGLSVGQLRDCEGGELIAAWEAGREAAGTDKPNPWRRGTPNAIAWQQGFERADLSCQVPRPAEAAEPKATPAKPKAEPTPSNKKTGSLF